MPYDRLGRTYAKLSELKAGDKVVVDDGFDCLLPWSTLTVAELDGELVVFHNTKECGACGGSGGDCPHGLEGQLDDDSDSLIGVYLAATFVQ